MSGPGERDLLAAIPFGRPLVALLRVLVAAERREEFVGDLVEQATGELVGRTPGQVSLWLWGETLHSAPALLALRLRRLWRRVTQLPGHQVRTAGAPVLLLGVRAEQRSWSLPMVVSLATHALALSVVGAFTIDQIDELQAPRVAVSMQAPGYMPLSRAAGLPLTDRTASVGVTSEPRPHRTRPVERPRPIAAPAPQQVAPAAPDAGALPGLPSGDRVEGELAIMLPASVAEGRCISCPPPRLPPAFVRLGSPQRVDVKTCVGTRGDVTSVEVLRGLGPLADASVVGTVRGWHFMPPSVGDHPVPFCYPTRFLFTMN
jgi:outer membrane biosynthesis protein TonB